MEFRAAVEAVAVGGEVLFPKYARPGPFLQDCAGLGPVVGNALERLEWAE